MSKKKRPGQKNRAFIDIETTGLHPDINEIISFAGQKYSPEGVLLDEIEFKIKFQHTEEPPPNAEHIWPGPDPFSPEKWKEGVDFCLGFNHYSEEEWADALVLLDALHCIADFLRGSVIVGHNPHFDREFIATKAKRLGLKVHFPYHKIDTVTLGYEHLAPLGLPYLSLSKRGGVCDFLGIPVEKAHEALDDVRRTAKVFFMLDKATWFDRLRWRFNWWWRRNLKISEVTGSIPDSGVA